MSVLRYMPIGGLGEVGRNMWALEWENDVLLIDAGLMFPDSEMHGVDLVIPDVSGLLEEGRRVRGIVLTHGHEDHIGALPFLLRRVQAPVYGTKLTLGLVRPKLKEHRILRESDLREVTPGEHFQIGPFEVETIHVCHSIPGTVALSIRTPVGRVVYTADFKLETDPIEGQPTDMARIRAIGDEGVLLLLSDSTNAERAGRAGSERDLTDNFERIFAEAPGRIVAATFASNIYRIQQLVDMAEQHGRKVAFAGRSLQRNVRTTRELGFMRIAPGTVIQLEEAERVQPSKLMLMTAGSQGEPVSALSRFASQTHPLINVRSGDRVLISATPIPGNERLVSRTINNLYRHGAEVFYSSIERVHVSGHAYRDELAEMLQAVRPHFFIPVHGEYRQMHHHAAIAAEVGIPAGRVLIGENGRAIEFTKDTMRKGGTFPAGRVFVDGLGIGDVEQIVLRDRQHLAGDGLIIVNLIVDSVQGTLRSTPELITRGVSEHGLAPEVEDEVRRTIVSALAKVHGQPEPELITELVHDAVVLVIGRRIQRRPMVIPVITEV